MNIKLFLNEKLCVWLCFLLENFLFTNLLSRVILLIVDGFLLSTNRFQHLKKKYFDDIIKHSAPNATFGFTVYRKMIFHVAIEVNNVFWTCWRGRGCWIWSILTGRIQYILHSWKKKRRGLSEFNGMSTMGAKNVYFKFHGEYGNILWCKMSVCLSKLLFWF